MIKNLIPTRALYDSFVEMGNCSYSYEEIVACINEAVAVDAEHDAAIQKAWQTFSEVTNDVDFLFMSDAQRSLYQRLADFLNECYGVTPEACKGGKELVPVRSIQKRIATTRRHTKRINSFDFSL